MAFTYTRYNLSFADFGPGGVGSFNAAFNGATGFWVLQVGMSPNITTTPSLTGVTWTQRTSQCSGRGTLRTMIFTGTGTSSSDQLVQTFSAQPGSFTAFLHIVTAGYNVGSPFTGAISKNTNGIGGACAGGTDTSSVSLTTTAAADNSLRMTILTLRNQALSGSGPADDNISLSAGSALHPVRSFAIPRTGGTLSETYNASMTGTEDWIISAIIINPSGVTQQKTGIGKSARAGSGTNEATYVKKALVKSG